METPEERKGFAGFPPSRLFLVIGRGSKNYLLHALRKVQLFTVITIGCRTGSMSILPSAPLPGFAFQMLGSAVGK